MKQEVLLTAFITSLALSSLYLGTQSISQDFYIDNQSEFQLFQQNYNINFKNEDEETYRLSVFQQNLKHIEETNSAQSSYKLGVNKFAHLTNDEFADLYLQELSLENMDDEQLEQIENYSQIRSVIPSSYDARKQYYPYPHIRDQGQCKSTYAIHTVSTLEALNQRASFGQFQTKLSPQNIISCNDFGAGCQESSAYKALQYVKQNGISTDLQYPYTSYNGQVQACQPNVPKTNIYFNSITLTGSGNTETMKRCIMYNTPITAIDGRNLHLYQSGVFNNCQQSNIKTMYVLAVGWGQYFGYQYWILQGSFGASWGENGFMRLQIGQCGAADWIFMAQ